MTTVAQRVTNNWPTTEPTLVTEVDQYVRSKQDAITDAIRTLWFRFDQVVVPPTTVDDLADVIQKYIANKATIKLIRIARDYFKELLLSTSAAVPGGGSTTESSYDRTVSLTQLRADLEEECAELEQELVVVMNALLVSTTRPVDVGRARFNPNNIFDPVERARLRG